MRRQHDAYYTPDHAVRELMKRRPDIGAAGQVVIEPCVGGGAIAQPFRERGCMVITNDLVPTIEADVHDDATQASMWRDIDAIAMAANLRQLGVYRGIDWVVTNPPFLVAMAILKQAFEFSKQGVALFLRLSFLEPTEERGAWLSLTPPDELIVLPRISFTGDGKSDSVTCAWMIWYRTEGMRSRAGAYAHKIEIAAELDTSDERQPALWGV